MGATIRAKCKACGRLFDYHRGGGFQFEILHCSTCGRKKTVPREDLPIEGAARRCGCGGEFRFDALPRCPRCLSTIVEMGETRIFYD